MCARNIQLSISDQSSPHNLPIPDVFPFLSYISIPSPSFQKPVGPCTYLLATLLTYSIGRTYRRAMSIKILVKPIAQNSSRALQPAYLHTFTTPPLLAMENAKGSPSNHEIILRRHTSYCLGGDFLRSTVRRNGIRRWRRRSIPQKDMLQIAWFWRQINFRFELGY